MEESNTTQINPNGASSYVAVYVHSNGLTQEEAQAIMGSGGGKIRNPNSYHKWMWNGPRNQYDDPAQSVRDFREKILPKMLPGITKMQKEYDAEVDVHLVIGIAKVKKTGEWPDINIDPTTLSELGQNNISLNIYLEQQMS
jgi:hypothetical protein